MPLIVKLASIEYSPFESSDFELNSKIFNDLDIFITNLIYFIEKQLIK